MKKMAAICYAPRADASVSRAHPLTAFPFQYYNIAITCNYGGRMTMKYLLKTALCLLLCALLSLPALAEEGEELTCGDYTYVLLEDGGARITGYDGEDAELTVPDELDGHPVREIGDDAFSSCVSLTTITLPESLTTIGDGAF